MVLNPHRTHREEVPGNTRQGLTALGMNAVLCEQATSVWMEGELSASMSYLTGKKITPKEPVPESHYVQSTGVLVVSSRFFVESGLL